MQPSREISATSLSPPPHARKYWCKNPATNASPAPVESTSESSLTFGTPTEPAWITFLLAAYRTYSTLLAPSVMTQVLLSILALPCPSPSSSPLPLDSRSNCEIFFALATRSSASNSRRFPKIKWDRFSSQSTSSGYWSTMYVAFKFRTSWERFSTQSRSKISLQMDIFWGTKYPSI